MNVAEAKGLLFGRDIIFPFGPYASGVHGAIPSSHRCPNAMEYQHSRCRFGRRSDQSVPRHLHAGRRRPDGFPRTGCTRFTFFRYPVCISVSDMPGCDAPGASRADIANRPGHAHFRASGGRSGPDPIGQGNVRRCLRCRDRVGMGDRHGARTQDPRHDRSSSFLRGSAEPMDHRTPTSRATSELFYRRGPDHKRLHRCDVGLWAVLAASHFYCRLPPGRSGASAIFRFGRPRGHCSASRSCNSSVLRFQGRVCSS